MCNAETPVSAQGFGVYRFANKYGANVDGYSPIYTPDVWSETGNEYKLGTKGLLAWCACWATRRGASLFDCVLEESGHRLRPGWQLAFSC